MNKQMFSKNNARIGERLVCMTSMGPTFDGAHNRILALSARASLQEYYLHPVGRYQLQCLESLLKLLDFSRLHRFSLDHSFK